MKNSKTKKVMAGILAAALITGTAGVLINKSDASFKFVADQEAVFNAAKFTAEVYEVDENGNKIGEGITLGSHTTTGTVSYPVKLPSELEVTNFLPGQSIVKTFVVKNTGDVVQYLEFVSGILEYSGIKENEEFARRLKTEVTTDSLEVEPGTTQKITLKVSFLNGEDEENSQGSDNAAIGGKCKAFIRLEIKDRKNRE